MFEILDLNRNLIQVANKIAEIRKFCNDNGSDYYVRIVKRNAILPMYTFLGLD